MADLNDFNIKEKPQWCIGCGDFGILASLKKALSDLNIEQENTVIVSGVGCGSKIPHYIRTYGYEGLHGRILPLAYGIHLANTKLKVIGIGGDGDGLAEGGNHFLNSFRYNANICYFLQNNQIYGLTTGQSSPTTQKGTKTKTAPEGAEIPEMKILPIAISSGATFVASTFAGNMKHCTETFKAAIQHRGFSFVNIYQPCVSWNEINTYDFWTKRCYDLQEVGHDKSNFEKAIEKAWEPHKTNWEKVPIGILYQEERPALEDYLGIKAPLAEKELLTDISSDLNELI